MKNSTFKYTYSAPTQNERKEVESILSEYVEQPKQTDKLVELKKCHSIVKNTPVTISLVFGILSSLIFGTGLTCFLEWNNIIIGIICSVIGVGLMTFTPFLNKKLIKHYKNKYREKIIKLSNEILNDEKN